MDKEKRFSGIEKCGHCGNSAPMEIVAMHSQIKAQYDEKTDFAWDAGDVYEVLACPACSKISLRTYFFHDGLDEDGVRFDVIYPATKESLLGLPVKVDKAYRAALKVRNIDVNAYGVLIGRVLEIVCQDRNAKGSTLNDKLKDLSQRGEIPLKLISVASSLRQLRNVGAHADLGELTPNEAPLLDDLCRAILEYVYSAPHLVKQVEKRLGELKKRRFGSKARIASKKDKAKA